jgi:hypothetical protein
MNAPRVLALLTAVFLMGMPLISCSATDDAARVAAQIVERRGLPSSSTKALEEWLKAMKQRTGLSFQSLADEFDAVAPTVVSAPPIRTAADSFVILRSVPETYRPAVRNVFIGTLCDTASLIAQGKPVDASGLVTSAIKAYAGTLSEVLELNLLRQELESKVSEFARAKSAGETTAVATDVTFTLECFVLGKVAT